MIDIGGIEVVSTGSRLLTAEDVTEVTAHIERLESENAKLRELVAQRTAKRVVASNADTDHATGRTACGACGGAIGLFDTYCRHCGTKLEEDA